MEQKDRLWLDYRVGEEAAAMTPNVGQDMARKGNNASPGLTGTPVGSAKVTEASEASARAKVQSENRSGVVGAVAVSASKKAIGFTEIKEKYLPHRYPILMLDRITDYELGEYVEAIKCVTCNSPELVGHFPGRAIMPATFIIQALAQLAIVYVQLSQGPLKEDEMTVVSTTKFKFLRPVFPGDTLLLRLTPSRMEDTVGIFEGIARVENKSVVRGSLTLAKTKISKFENPLW